MKITRERLEQILREELAAVTEGRRSEYDHDEGGSGHNPNDPKGRPGDDRPEQEDKPDVGPLYREGQWDDQFNDPFSPGYKQTPEQKAKSAKDAERGKKKWERPEEPDDAFKGLSTRDITVDQPVREGMGQTLANTIREMLESAVEELGKMHETGSAEYKAAMETLRKEVKLALGKDDN